MESELLHALRPRYGRLVMKMGLKGGLYILKDKWDEKRKSEKVNSYS
jgi:hypothetical protein